MLATITGVGILAWVIGFFDPTTCTPSAQQPRWTSFDAMAQQRTIALWVLIIGNLEIVVFLWLRGRKKN